MFRIGCLLALWWWSQMAFAQDFTAVTTRMQQLVQQQGLPGASVLIVRNGQVVYQQAFGGYSLDQRLPIASASKWLSAAVLARLVDRGVMRWDDRIERYLPQAPADKRALTLRQLYSHSSGLPGGEIDCIGTVDMPFQNCVDQILAQPLEYSPGQGFAYGGNSMHVAGRLAEIASGQRWDDLFRAEVATPLGLTHTDFAFFSTTPGYVVVSNPRIAGGVRSTLADYGRFVQAILERGAVGGQQWLSPALIDQMAEDQTHGAPVLSTPYPEALGYGIGQWRERVDAQGRALAVSSPGAFGSYPVVDHEAGYAGVFLTLNLLRNIKEPVQAMWADVRNIVQTPAPQPPRLLLQGGYGGGNYPAGTQLHAFAEATGATRMFVGWRGDGPLLADPRGWHASPQQAPRASTLTAQFQSVSTALTTATDSINGSRYRWIVPANARALLFSFHGSGGSGDLPFTKPEAQITARLLLSRGFGVVGLDSSNRVDRQWNPQYSLSNPDVVNVLGIIDRLRASGSIGANTPIFCEGTSNGGGFCSRTSALLGWRGQSLMIADGNETIMLQSTVPTIWTLGSRDPTLAPGYLERSQASADGMAARGIPFERNVVAPSPVYPERFARIEGISVEASRALTETLRSGGFLDAAGMVIADPRSAALSALIPPALRSYNGDIVAQLEIAYGAHEYYSDYAHRAVHFLEAQLTPNFTGLWWKPDEPGWGLSIAHQGDSLFPTWYTFDASGKPTWYVGGAMTRQTDGSYAAPAYKVTGRPYQQIAGDSEASAQAVGQFSLRPRSDGALDFSYEIATLRQTRRVEQIRFGRLPACRLVSGDRALSPNRSDIWWNPREPGWGVYLTEQDNTLVLTWYTYGADRQPLWLLATLARQPDGSFRGALTRASSGTPFDQISGAATSFPVPVVGTAAVEFIDGERALFRYALDGVSQSKDIERYVYAGPEHSDCQ